MHCWGLQFFALFLIDNIVKICSVKLCCLFIHIFVCLSSIKCNVISKNYSNTNQVFRTDWINCRLNARNRFNSSINNVSHIFKWFSVVIAIPETVWMHEEFLNILEQYHFTYSIKIVFLFFFSLNINFVFYFFSNAAFTSSWIE